MATHVIEIVSGIGEPGFVPLTMGKELPTLSIGRRGQWKVAGAGILDVHAYAYFDGQALFLQSTDPNNAACVDGFPVGTSWTEVRPPCAIELGGARLEYREEESGDDTTQAIPNPAPAPMQRAAPVPAAGRPPEPGMRSAPPPAMAPQAPQASGSAPGGARPFQPGAFSSRQEDEGESTRVAPLDMSVSRGGKLPAAGSGQSGQFGAQSPNNLSGSFGGMQPPMMQSGMQPAMMQSGMQPGMMQPGMQPGMMQPGMQPGMMQSGMHPGMMQPGMQAGMSGGYPVQAGMGQPGMGPSGSGQYPMQPGFGNGSMPGMAPMSPFPDQQAGQPNAPGQPPPEPDALKKAVEDFKSASPVRKITLILLPIAMLAGASILFADDPPPPKPRVDAGVEAGVDSGMLEAGTALGTAPTDTTQGVVGTQTQTSAQIPVPNPPGPTTGHTVGNAPTDAGLSTVDAGKGHLLTLERQAVDQVYRGDIAGAVDTYERLAREQPQNPSYSYAARILRERLNGGAAAPVAPSAPAPGGVAPGQPQPQAPTPGGR